MEEIFYQKISVSRIFTTIWGRGRMGIHQERIGWGRTHQGQFDWGNSPSGNSSHPNSNINYNLHSQPDFAIYSCFMSSMWTSERQSNNWGKQGNHHCGWGFWEESIEEARGSILLNTHSLISLQSFEYLAMNFLNLLK